MDNRNHYFYYLILFLISPVLAVVASMANFKHRNARLTLVLFVATFGYTMILSPGKDSFTHATAFLEVYQYMTIDEFLNLIVSVITLEGGKHLGASSDELYMPVLFFSLVQFTTETSWLFFITGLVYGYFFIRGISLVYSDMHRNWNMALFILFVFFISWKSLEGLNSIRNWTGAWIFFNGAYMYLKTRNPSYILLVLLAPLFHVGYLVITFPFFAYLIIGDRKYVLLGILVLSYLFSSSTAMVEPYLTSTGLGEAKMNSYAIDDEVGVELTDDDRSFHVRYFRFASDLIIQFLFIYSILFLGFLKNKNHDKLKSGLAGLAILMLSLANFSGFAPVLVNRVFVNFGFYALAYMILHFSEFRPPPGIHRNVVYITIPGILLFIFTQYSMIGDFMDFKAFISPLVYPFLGDDPVSIKEFIRSILG